MEEALVVPPSREGSTVRVAAELNRVGDLFESGLPVHEIIFSQLAPENIGRFARSSLRRLMVEINIVVEGLTDIAVARRLCGEAGMRVSRVFPMRGKSQFDRKLHNYNKAAYYQTNWLVLRDLDQDATCAPTLRVKKFKNIAPGMLLRIPVRAVEAWLLADNVSYFYRTAGGAVIDLLLDFSGTLRAIEIGISEEQWEQDSWHQEFPRGFKAACKDIKPAHKRMAGANSSGDQY